jgi:MFS family permease
LPSAPPVATERPATAPGRVREAEDALQSVIRQLREGFDYIRGHREVRWSLTYLGIAASLVGVLGVLGPSFAQKTLGLGSEDFVVVVLPLGIGIVMGILLLNAYGRLIPRRRVIEGGLIALGIFLVAMALSGRISSFLASSATRTGLPDLSLLTSLLSIVVAVAFFAGIAYAAVAIPAQTQLQEDIPEDVRGRVFGVLNMLVSVASFLPILIVGPIADTLGTTIVLLLVGGLIAASGVASIYLRGPLGAIERGSRATVGTTRDPFVEALEGEIRRPERFLQRYGDGAADAPGPEASPNAEVMPAADPLTASAAPFDPDAVTRPMATDEVPGTATPNDRGAGDDTGPERG